MHMFLTGGVQVGKTTAIARFLALHPELRPGGFRTVAGARDGAGFDRVYLLPAVGGMRTEENCVLHRRGRFPARELLPHPAVFDTVGVALLAERAPCALILMDEIGFAENEARRFHRAVWERLNGRTPVLGVLREKPTVLGDLVRRHSSVCLRTVTEENRADMPKELERWWQKNGQT